MLRTIVAEWRVTGPTTSSPVTVSAIVCTCDQGRFGLLEAAVESLQRQTLPPDEIVIVVDHDRSLFRRAEATFPFAHVVENDGQRGLSGARNTGVANSSGTILVFLDDDARAEATCIRILLEAFDDLRVAGAGAVAIPEWPGGARPRWFPPEFDWVVGCSYVGLPEEVAPVRNLIGAGMALRRSTLERVGGFDPTLGRVGSLPSGCEETELGIRVGEQLPDQVLLHLPEARVRHTVSPGRTRLRYFAHRCFAEGVSKAAVARLTGQRQALATERRYVRDVLPRALIRDLRRPSRSDSTSRPVRALAVLFGLSATASGYLWGRSALLVRR